VSTLLERLDRLQELYDRSRLVLDVAPGGWALFSKDRSQRYALGRSWSNMLRGSSRIVPPVALFCGLNPSDAGATEPDQTIRKEVGFADRIGCDELIKVNLYPWISTDPEALFTVDATEYDDEVVGALLRIMLPTAAQVLTICAWGGHPRATAARVAAVTRFLPGPLHCFGTTKDGQPKHPCRLAYATPLERWKGIE